VIVDTAGVRRRSKVTQSVEKFSVMRTLSSIERADVVVTVIDGTQGVTEQDVRIAGYGHEAGRAAVIAVNKWDIVERDERTVVEFERKVRYDLSYMDYAPIVFVSALTGRRVNKLMEAVTGAAMEHRRRVPTGALNRVMEDAILRFPHPAQNGKQVKIFYITQVDVAPPTFAAFCNYPELVHFSYKRYMENKVREAFGFAGTPIVIVTRKRE